MGDGLEEEHADLRKGRIPAMGVGWRLGCDLHFAFLGLWLCCHVALPQKCHVEAQPHVTHSQNSIVLPVEIQHCERDTQVNTQKCS